ncbi:MAG: magnesium transporter [Chloroflexi bacterium]|nr:magnesium transporter [Chloroflexota bacterium]
MLNLRLTPDIDRLLTSRQWAVLGQQLATYPAPDIADVLAQQDAGARSLLFRALPRALEAEVFALLDADQQEALLHDLSGTQTRELLSALPPDDRTELLAELPADVTRRLLTLLSPDDLVEARQLLGYPEESIGRLMTPDLIDVRGDWTVGRALAQVRVTGRDAETLDMVYVVDDAGRLLDDLRLRQLVLADPEATVDTLMDGTFVSLRAIDNREEAVRAMAKYDRVALPVVDSQGALLGIVTVDDVLDVAEAEATEDFQKLGGQEALGAPYMQLGLLPMVRKRGGWLAALFLGEMLTATAMGYFEEEIARAVVLALFIPLIISSGGNSGSQATSLLIRAMALREVGLRDWWRVLAREVPTGVALGSILGVIGLTRIMLWQALGWANYGEHYLLVGLTIFLSLIGVVLFGTLAGSLLPFLLRRLGFDPASASAPFVATLVDVSGIIIYFTVASLVLRGTLL